ncbi:MAG: hypothetical protein R3B98_08265 [Hyphomonas sp.]|nr:hypothetical protein [Hyphomonas sp.]MCB9972676.1 hypothetical protein [Hyphomonas sp.]
MSGHQDMSGLWSGEYRYDHDGMCVRFTAMITETDGKLCGTTLEPATFGPLAGPDGEYEATIRGDRCGQHVLFSKRYLDSIGNGQPPLLYSGAVDATFTLINGRWTFAEPALPSGTFSLSRVTTRTCAVIASVAEAGS